MNQKTKLFVIIALIATAIISVGLTYAYFEWQSEETSVVITVDGAPISYNAGADITGNLLPTLTKEEGISKDITVKLTKDNYESYITYYLKINELPEELKHVSFKYEMYKNNVLNKSGSFESANVDDVIAISQSNALSNIEDTYTLYLWIDGNMENPTEMQGQQFSFTLYAQSSNVYTSTGILTAPEGCEKTVVMDKINGVSQLVEKVVCPANLENADTSGATGPELFEGMIPVKWNESNELVKANITNPTSDPWYNYTGKMWANAVMVTSDTRETYMNAEAGSVITTSDVLAYWVWIPRYRYKLFNVEFASGTSPQTIEIAFESLTTEKSAGTTNGEWLTHPAFTFGDAELNGFWMAKFEPSGSSTAGNLKVLPGVASLRNQTLSAQYNASQLFASDAYVTSDAVTKVDSHMIKNIEWGAVAYLSHSIYGINEEITKNASSSYYTGGGSETAYITNTVQSTTGTIYGVYDMSGGAWDRVMGNYNGSSGSSGISLVSDLGKYVDIYKGSTIAYSKLGDALGETVGWYSDTKTFVNSSEPWFRRGGGYDNGAEAGAGAAGAFGFGYYTGASATTHSFRTALTAK